MKKIGLYIFCCLSLCCFFGNFRSVKIADSSSQKANDTIRFFQICTDTINLPIYEPTEAGRYLLYKVLNTKHQNFLRPSKGTFEVSEKTLPDTTLSILFIDRNINFFAQYGWNSFKGIVYYQNYIFLLCRDISDESLTILFKYTKYKKAFTDYADKLYVKVDEKILWQFVKREGTFRFVNFYPPSTILDFEDDVMN